MSEQWHFILIAMPFMDTVNTTRVKQCHTSGKTKLEAQIECIKKN